MNPKTPLTSKRQKAPISLSSILSDLEKRAPEATAEKWDNVGLIIGKKDESVSGAVISIDLTRESIELAKRLKFNLILNHHPCIFPKGHGVSRVCEGGETDLIYSAAAAGISVISVHTNFDQCALEVPMKVSEALGFKALGRLYAKGELALTKFAVTVPETHAQALRDALTEAGAGKIGSYDSCTFTVTGEGTFRPREGAEPFLGSRGVLERVAEVRIETVFPRGLRKQVLKAMRAAHPYEEIAYDLFSVEQSPSQVGLVSGLGYGVYGDFATPVPFERFAKRIKEVFGIDGFLMTDPAPKKLKRVAFVAGKGTSFIESARSAGCDLFITGEAGYHDAREAANAGLGVLELGHRESELFFLKTIEVWCREWGIRFKGLNTPVQRFRS
ncbi:MAG: Nif3-like dinuclear metal center hexameric protein [Cryobacterium sp.]|nr:Nif3-like dinuclear metal center hexameric protein [Oligoflexia bacterium]